MTTAVPVERAIDALTAYGLARATVSGMPLSAEELRKTHAYWRACTYLMLGIDLSAGQPSTEGTTEARAR
jgi:xylulose-5-phosphate/fructose-6-phosphate phosphoketolase